MLYLHGLMGYPTPEKMSLLAPKAENLYYPSLDYFNHPDLFGWLLGEVADKKIDYIVGSSAGGLMAYWLARRVGCKALLFNPALAKFSVRADITQHMTGYLPTQPFFYDIVIGTEDDTIVPQTTFDFLATHDLPAHYQLHIREGLGHRIDIDTFSWAVGLIP